MHEGVWHLLIKPLDPLVRPLLGVVFHVKDFARDVLNAPGVLLAHEHRILVLERLNEEGVSVLPELEHLRGFAGALEERERKLPPAGLVVGAAGIRRWDDRQTVLVLCCGRLVKEQSLVASRLRPHICLAELLRHHEACLLSLVLVKLLKRDRRIRGQSEAV